MLQIKYEKEILNNQIITFVLCVIMGIVTVSSIVCYPWEKHLMGIQLITNQ